MRFRLSAAICVGVVLALAGCGGSGGSSSTTSASSSLTAAGGTSTGAASGAHGTFVAKLNPICATYNRRIQSIQADLQAQGAKAQASGKLKPYIGPLTEARQTAAIAGDQVTALTPPAGEKPQATAIAKSLKNIARLNGMLIKAARTNDSTQFTAVSTAEQEFASQAQAVMRAYGMTTVCGAPS